MKKTTSMKNLLESANAMLMNPNLSQDTKKGIAFLLENALHESNSYSGYNNFRIRPDGSGVGVSKGQEGYEEWTRLYFTPKGGF